MHSEEGRIDIFLRILAMGFLLSVAFSKTLWFSDRSYPLVPLLHFIPVFPHWFDISVFVLLVGLLVVLLIRPRSKGVLVSLLILVVLLFVQDTDRMWPSFYEYFFLLLAFLLAAPEQTARFIIAAVYVWSGVQKFTPHFFSGQFPWLFDPLIRHLHLASGLVTMLGVIAALFEISIGLMLFSRRFQTIALTDALLMHGAIFFLIAPWWSHGNPSAWIWNLVSVALIFVLFYKAPSFRFRALFPADAGSFQTLGVWSIILFIGVMPLFNNIGLWPSHLSFNIYTGNVTQASLSVYGEPIDLNRWSIMSFNAAPVPEARSFEAVLSLICSSAPLSHAQLVIMPKENWFSHSLPYVRTCGS